MASCIGCPNITPPSAEGLRDGPAGFDTSHAPPMALLDFFFPGFSMLSSILQRYLKIDLNVYIPLILLLGCLVAAWRYLSDYLWSQIETYFMASVDIRTDDEIYNMLMGWVAQQRFASGARRFVVNTDLNSRAWYISWRWDTDNDDEEKDEGSSGPYAGSGKKSLAYTPTFGSHYFFYKRRLCIFRRDRGRGQDSGMMVSEKEEITISCFGRNPNVLKELLMEARSHFMKRDESKTLIYRGTTRPGASDPIWQRAMARESRPFSTVILNEKKKQDLIEDVTDYLNPATRRWYANRGIPYRRGYLLYGPPGTGKSSLSLALAGFFKMRIYIVSLSSISSTEENLATLFAELPRRCVVLLEDIDTAGLTHTREENGSESGEEKGSGSSKQSGNKNSETPSFRLSLSGLLNILDGVASQEGRVLIMTTNHLEKLDKALIRPGRVDKIVEFGLSDSGMISSIFCAIFAPLEADAAPSTLTRAKTTDLQNVDPAEVVARVDADKIKREKAIANIERLAAEFAAKIPAHEFSPAELQGFLLKNKRDPEGAVAGAEAWVIETRTEKAAKQLKEAEEKRKKEKKEKEEEIKKKKEEEEKEKKKEEKREKKSSSRTKKRGSRKNRRSSKTDDSSSSSSSSDSASSSSSSDSESEVEQERKTKRSSPKEINITIEEVPKEKSKAIEPGSAITERSDSFVDVKQTLDTCGDSGQTRPGSAGRDSGYSTPE